MIDLSELMFSPELSQQFTVYRRTGSWASGNFLETETPLTMTGIVVPANSKEILQFPEGDRSTAMMCFFSDQEIYTTRMADPGEDFGQGTSDQIEWRKDRYRVISVNQFADYGYWKAFAVAMEGY